MKSPHSHSIKFILVLFLYSIPFQRQFQMYFICGAAGCGIKVIVYLNNVGKTGGPYEYIPPLWTDKIIKALGYTSGFVSDEASAKIAPPTEWKTCAAKAGTIIITDPRSVFHRAKPAKRNRYSITFGYTSQFPQVSLSEFKLSPAEWQRVNPSLSKRQLSLCSKNFRRTHVITHRSLILKSIYLINEANNSLCKAFSSLIPNPITKVYFSTESINSA